MKLLLFLTLFLFACGTTNSGLSQRGNGSTEQVFVAGPGSGQLPGKCYVKTRLGNETPWTETICSNQITKRLIKQIQADLVRLNYEIEDTEIAKAELGPTTKASIKAFQQKHNMAYGALDWATVNRLKL